MRSRTSRPGFLLEYAMLEHDSTDYCHAADEQAKNPDAERHMQEIANGNSDAFRFMWKFWCFSHVLDDLVDQDKPVTVEQAAKANAEMFQELTLNPFYQHNAALLLPHLVGVFNRWADGEEWEGSDDRVKQIASHVVKCGDVDLYLTVAYLTGGWDHMRRCRDARKYDPNKFLEGF
jgi:hypothetical protein